MRSCLLLLLLFLLITDVFAQSKPVKNSLKEYEKLNKDIEKDRKSFNASKKAFDSTQKIHLDSLKETMMQKDIQQNTKNLDAFVAEKKEKERGEENALWVRAALLLVTVAGLIIIKVTWKKKG